MKKIAIFASGSGTNAENIIKYFADSAKVRVILVLSNNADAKVLERAKRLNVDNEFFATAEFKNGDVILRKLAEYEIDFVILAGFMAKIPTKIIDAYPQRIVNIHPALLPKFGGKGMYGHHVHDAVVAAGEKESGITIHYINDRYDEGAIIAQKTVPVLPTDTAADVEKKIHALEYEWYPKIVEKVLDNLS